MVLDNSSPQLSLGPLEREILDILWQRSQASVREIQDVILGDPDRELTTASITTVLQRLSQKGWVARTKTQRAYAWHPLISRSQAQALQAEDRLNQFLAVGSSPEVVAAFADRLDQSSVQQLERIAEMLKQARANRQS